MERSVQPSELVEHELSGTNDIREKRTLSPVLFVRFYSLDVEKSDCLWVLRYHDMDTVPKRLRL